MILGTPPKNYKLKTLGKTIFKIYGKQNVRKIRREPKKAITTKQSNKVLMKKQKLIAFY